MSKSLIGRRGFLGQAASVTAAFSNLSKLPGFTLPPCRTIRIRKSIASLAEEGPELTAYRKAVTVMKSRDPAIGTLPTDPTSWMFWANMHGTSAAGGDALFNTCQHGQYFFFPWHRMYVYFFERVVRQASGDPGFSLPYWNYSDPAQRPLPAAFRSPTLQSGAPNSLYADKRVNGVTLLDGTVSLDALTEVPFLNSGATQGFGGVQVAAAVQFGPGKGRCERVPHDVVHSAVGGFGGLMANPLTSAQDPIFWLHHANIDRLWSRWIALGGGRANPTATGWLDMPFGFYDGNGQLMAMQVGDSLHTQVLGYQYDDDPIGALVASFIACNPIRKYQIPRLTRRQEEILRSIGNPPPIPPLKPFIDLRREVALGARDPIRVPLVLSKEARTDLGRLFSLSKPTPTVMRFSGVTVTEAIGGYYDIYLGAAGQSVPKGKSDTYVDAWSLFGVLPKDTKMGDTTGAHAHVGSTTAQFDFEVTVPLRSFVRGASGKEELELLIVPRMSVADSEKGRGLPTGPVVRIQRITIGTEK